MPIYTDQLNRAILLETIPKRIISLVPSQTELLFDLGLNAEVIGITKFCIHPKEWFQTKTRIGGTKNINIEKIKQLKPDLIIANKEENVKEQIEALQAFCSVWISDVNNLNDALQMIESIGTITGKKHNAKCITQRIINSFSQLTTHHSPITCCYLIWREPYMTVGGDTFINDMLERCGFINVFKQSQRYPIISIEAIQQQECDLILLSSEPYPFKQQHIEEIKSKIKNSRTQVLLVDGEMFSWYGSRLIQSTQYFHQLMQTIAMNK
ncbi:MAG: cobalamin-binding protein [Chitinophaga sp.]|jgi:ABC-type Fe3+-hydroxamate transport system substrate-binding protein|nr:cobalamin-binding protein [Chitinophaga sp.]